MPFPFRKHQVRLRLEEVESLVKGYEKALQDQIAVGVNQQKKYLSLVSSAPIKTKSTLN